MSQSKNREHISIPLEEVLKEFSEKLSDEQTDVDPEISKIIDDNFEDLI